MLLALTDLLRCTNDHAESPLVARADVVEARRLVAGVLGCPVCRAERTVAGGVVHWAASAPAAATPPDPRPDTTSDALMRVAALLGLAAAPSPYVLGGDAGLAAAGLVGLTDATLVLLDPPDDRAAALATVIRGAPRVPFGPRSIRGITLDVAWAADPSRIASAVTALAARGRLVAPAAAPVPAGVREVARDAAQWVAEREADVVPLQRSLPR
ncbi:MAG TPA: hypothetical protein VG916_07255 [Gemmatimonadaceae bacterium]|nr:hypothetical protein [Gemmatimonadaceae bacterium]